MSEDTKVPENDVMNFGDEDAIKIPVTVKGVNYILNEASADGACQYRNAVLKCMAINSQGKASSVSGPLADTEPFLVSLCLVDEGGHRVHLSIVRSWPNRVVSKLYNKAKEISELDETDEDEDSAKNVQNVTTDGSD